MTSLFHCQTLRVKVTALMMYVLYVRARVVGHMLYTWASDSDGAGSCLDFADTTSRTGEATYDCGLYLLSGTKPY